ncbi:hypothetical protein KVR01_007254 [Diaporthe batatas]|uniref:uncharacterized protein n=1 Tax=Diaporthe batatas TaxID=748121 RepID=UPI001D043A34|nr:uncharacterized protein KVR01_007254 [Diaporthe batatas]KAG8162776.1 hypothetical protein KVR01_007254 [Diaporthe batatas]
MSSAEHIGIEKDEEVVSSSPAAEVGKTASVSGENGVESSSDESLDESYQVFKATEDLRVDPAEAKRVLRKIDLRVVPVLFFTYMLQYLDKNSLNFASVYGLKQGTNLHGQDYSWLGSIFYFGYLVAQFPSSFALQALPIGKFVSVITVLWGAILMTTPACTSFAGIATNRFLLGFFEAAINPAFVIIMSIWYTSEEQPLRLEAYYCTNGIATMFGGLIGYAVGHITTGIAGWMYVFIIFGSLSVFWGVVSLLVLPDLPSTARFLDERERLVAVDRVARNRQGVKNRHFRSYQAVQCARDPKTWILFVMAVAAQVPNAAITSFSSLIINGFGFDTLGSQYLQIPGGAVQFLALIIGGWICSKWPQSRCITMIVANTICIIGAALLVGLPDDNKWGRLVALWLCYFQGLGFSMSLTMISSNIAGSTKKQLTAAVLFTGYCIGNIVGPQTFIDSEAPRYHSAYIAMLVGYSIKLLAVVVLYIYMWRVNKARDAAGHTNDREAVEKGMHDTTELDNPGFRPKTGRPADENDGIGALAGQEKLQPHCTATIFQRHDATRHRKPSLPRPTPTTPPAKNTTSSVMSKRTSSAATNGGAQKAGQVSSYDKQKDLLSSETGHFSLIRAMHLADLITELNGFCGIMSVFSSLRYCLQDDYSRGNIYAALAFLPFGLFFDFMDGKVARWRKKSSMMGQELDSLADLISFGLAPAVVAFAIGMRTTVDHVCLAFFVLCGLTRLARFNVTATSIPKDATGKAHYFEGTPIPTSLGLDAVMAYWVSQGWIHDAIPGGLWLADTPFAFHPVVAVFMLHGCLMTSKTIHVPKP